MIPDIVHDSITAGALLVFLCVLLNRKQGFALPVLVGLVFIFCYWNQSRFPEVPTPTQYIVFHMLEAATYLLASLFLVRLDIKGAIATGRVYFFLFTYDLVLLLEYYVVNTKSWWSTPYAYNSFELVGVAAVFLIVSFVLFGDWYSGYFKRRGVVANNMLHSGANHRHSGYGAKK